VQSPAAHHCARGPRGLYICLSDVSEKRVGILYVISLYNKPDPNQVEGFLSVQ
jgi:hypothetical protein